MGLTCPLSGDLCANPPLGLQLQLVGCSLGRHCVAVPRHLHQQPALLHIPGTTNTLLAHEVDKKETLDFQGESSVQHCTPLLSTCPISNRKIFLCMLSATSGPIAEVSDSSFGAAMMGTRGTTSFSHRVSRERDIPLPRPCSDLEKHLPPCLPSRLIPLPLMYSPVFWKSVGEGQAEPGREGGGRGWQRAFLVMDRLLGVGACSPDESEQVDGVHTRGKQEGVHAGNPESRTLGGRLQVSCQLLGDMQQHLDVLVVACTHLWSHL